MSKRAYPSGTDLENFLAGCGFTIGAALAPLLDDAAAAGRAEVESQCSRKFVAVAGTREFDPPTNPQGYLDLRTDLATLTSLTVAGTAYALGTDFYLDEQNAADAGQPYRAVVFERRWYAPLPFAQRRSVVIVGNWGYGSVPTDVWTAMLERGALGLWGHLVRGISGGIVSWTEGDLRIDYGAGQWTELQGSWENRSVARVKPYQRWS